MEEEEMIEMIVEVATNLAEGTSTEETAHLSTENSIDRVDDRVKIYCNPITDSHKILQILQSPDEDRLCSITPHRIQKPGSFAVDLNKVNLEDVTKDGNGVYLCYGTRKVALQKQDCQFHVCRSAEDCEFWLVRRSYKHKASHDFKRQIFYVIRAKEGNELGLPTALVVYEFKDVPHEVPLLPRGNCKGVGRSRVFAGRKKSVVNALMRNSVGVSAAEAVERTISNLAAERSGYTSEAEICDRGMVYYHSSRLKRQKARCDLDDQLGAAKSLLGADFKDVVRSVTFIPEFSVVLALPPLIDDCVRFSSNKHHRMPISVHPSLKFGQFHVTPITFSHLLLNGIEDEQSPSFIGAVLIHSSKSYAAYRSFFRTLEDINPDFKSICVYGTTDDEELISACADTFLDAVHLRCVTDFKQNVERKLVGLSVGQEECDTILHEIFGSADGTVENNSCLLASESPSKYQTMFEHLRNQSWNIFEPTGEFSDFMTRHRAMIEDCMLSPIRTTAGLGSPPANFLITRTEAIHATFHSCLQRNETDLGSFVSSLKELFSADLDNIRQAYVNQSSVYQLKPEFMHLLSLNPAEMTALPRARYIRSMETCDIDILFENHDEEVFGTTVKPDLAKVKVPLKILTLIWRDARRLLSEGSKTMKVAPTRDPTTVRKFSVLGEPRNHEVSVFFHPHRVKCTCLRYSHYSICAHSVAVAEQCSLLGAFIKWHRAAFPKSRLTMSAGIRKVGKNKNSKTVRGRQAEHTNLDY